ncbi:NAD-dependent dihydropyrimidine dehydrogenase subunit PreA [bacterium]|nr:NAD-dependent dihydropyrimidine dehydrogenase subunit PreA [bacterium]MBR1620480.1 NAD-dependent dihydropyrimidine dehydrogenase subunit PreA [bacterium]
MLKRGYNMATLKTSILGIEFENPFLLASAPPTASIEGIDKAFEMGWGGAVLKTITPDDLEMIEASPRYAAIKEKGKVICFQNIELLSHETIKYWVDGIKYLKEKHPTKVIIASIMATLDRDEWQNIVKILNETPIDAYELNFSCPHGMPERNIGMAIGTNTDISILITSWVKSVATKPVFVKLTPNVTDIAWIAQAVEKAGADGFAAINTVQGFMGINLDTLEPVLNIDGYSTYGGLSGEAVKPIGFRCVAQLRQNSDLPILGMGGISNWEDAAQYIAVGSDAVQVCTEVMLNGYGIINGLKSGLLNFLETKGFNDISELKNIAVKKITSHENLNKKSHLYPLVDREKCIKCGKCVKICSESEYNALSTDKDCVYLDKKSCAGCSLCSHVCPKEAIKMCG